MYTLVGGEVIFDVPFEKYTLIWGTSKWRSPPPKYTLNIYVDKQIFQGYFPKNPRNKIPQKQFCFSSHIWPSWGLQGGLQGGLQIMYIFTRTRLNLTSLMYIYMRGVGTKDTTPEWGGGYKNRVFFEKFESRIFVIQCINDAENVISGGELWGWWRSTLR